MSGYHIYAAAPALACLPAFLLTISPEYRIPFPLYVSGGLRHRMLAAAWPTDCLSTPEILITVFPSISKLIPSTGSTITGCENPKDKDKPCPCFITRYPVPTSSSFLLKPLSTPSITAWALDLVIPWMDFAKLVSSILLTPNCPPSWVIDASGGQLVVRRMEETKFAK